MQALFAPASVAALVVVAALSGCLGAPPQEPLAPADDEPEPAPLDDFRPPQRAPPEGNASSNASAPSVAPPPTAPAPPPLPDPGPLVVIAHVDTGINPYHRTFRDTGPLALVHPSRWLPGFPADAPALNLSLDAPSYEEARIRDQAVWDTVERGKLYWIPGTRIVGAISFGPGGARCPQPLVGVPPLPDPLPPWPPAVPTQNACRDTPILDDHGHGTMTASRMAAADHSLCPSCRIVSVEGLGAQGVRWAADQGWIDVQTNSWGDLVPGVVPDAVEVDGLALGNAGIRDAFAFAAQRMLVFAASGNGVAFQGGVGEPTLAYATGAAGVLLVGADDNGRVNLYPGTPHHVVADGYGGWHANATSMDAFGPSHEACCTSAASPYAAGGAAAVLLEARRLLGHAGTGWHDGVGARGRVVPGGALDDGRLDLGELHHLLRATASPRPVEGPDDGLVHWLATAKSQDDLPDPLTEPGQNPYCPACWTYPLQWGDVPDDAPAFALVGYGAVDGLSVANAVSILRGQAGLPDRTADDALFEADQLARAAVDALP